MQPRFDLVHPAMAEVYRAMTPAERVQAGLSATEMIRQRLEAEVMQRHPRWSRARIEAAVAERLLDVGR